MSYFSHSRFSFFIIFCFLTHFLPICWFLRFLLIPSLFLLISHFSTHIQPLSIPSNSPSSHLPLLPLMSSHLSFPLSSLSFPHFPLAFFPVVRAICLSPAASSIMRCEESLIAPLSFSIGASYLREGQDKLIFASQPQHHLVPFDACLLSSRALSFFFVFSLSLSPVFADLCLGCFDCLTAMGF